MTRVEREMNLMVREHGFRDLRSALADRRRRDLDLAIADDRRKRQRRVAAEKAFVNAWLARFHAAKAAA
jgi:hypothetical protein